MPVKIINFQQAKNALQRCAARTDKGVTELAGITLEAMEELDAAKADKPLHAAVTVQTFGWSEDGATNYPKYYDIAVSGVTASDRADIVIAPGSLAVAVNCGFCPVTETRSDAVRVRAVSVPAAPISAQLWIQKGR